MELIHGNTLLDFQGLGGCQSETCVAGKGKDCHVPGIRPGKGVLELDSEGKRLRYIGAKCERKVYPQFNSA